MAEACVGAGRLTGTIKSFSAEKGWGFVSSDAFVGDLFLSLTAHKNPQLTRNLHAGMEVEFEVESEGNGKVVAAKTVLTTSSPMIIKPPNANSPMTEGWIKSFNMKNSWGFIQSDAVEGDVFFSLQRNPQLGSTLQALQQGARVSFSIQTEEASNKRIATGVFVHGSGQRDGVSPTVVTGWVKSFNPHKGWGFLQASEFGNDVFFSTILNPHLQTISPQSGEAARFEVTEEKEGKTVAVNVQLMRSGTARQQTMPQANTGWVKSFNPTKGWGFLQANGFGNDIFFSTTLNPHLQGVGLYAGDTVKFEVTEEAQGRTVGVNVQPMRSGSTRQPSMQQVITGWVKSFNPTKGWGFLQANELSTDVFFSTTLNPHLQGLAPQSGETARFGVTKEAEGKLVGVNVQLMRSGSAMQPPMPQVMLQMMPKMLPQMQSQQYKGQVKSYNAEKGWGFLVSSAMGQDVFFSLRTNPHLTDMDIQPGVPVTFSVSVEVEKGKLMAENVAIGAGGNGKGKQGKGGGKAATRDRSRSPHAFGW